MDRLMLTQAQAQSLVEAHEIEQMTKGEEARLLAANNPELYEAYRRLLQIADGQ